MYRETIRDALKMPRLKKNKIFYKENLVLGDRLNPKNKEFTPEKGKRCKLLNKKIQLKQPWGLNLLAMMPTTSQRHQACEFLSAI